MTAKMCLWLLLGVLAGVEDLSQIQVVAGDPAPIDADQPRQAAKVARFQFGTPTSVTRTGFTKVTVKDLFNSDQGYGFQSTQDLLAFDRGGSQISLPKDGYTASTYGAYRTTADLTCAFIEGQSDNAFQVNLPEGEYTVWLIASDAEWDPPLFEAWANGQKKLEVRIPRARFVFMEPFQAHTEDGCLKIELKGSHGWLLNGLVIGKEGPELATLVTQLERDIFFLTEPELPNWKEAKSQELNPPLEWHAAEQEKGYVVFSTDYTEPILPTFVPERAMIDRPLTAFATPGEFEPATFGIVSRKELGSVAVELSDFVAEDSLHTIKRKQVQMGIVRCWPQRSRDWGGKGEYRVVPELIEAPVGRATQMAANQVKQWWLTVQVPSNAPPGCYRMALTVRPEKAPPTTLEWRLLVLPFQLIRPLDKHWGTWLESFPPVGGLRGPERRGRNTPAEEARLVRADLADYHDHGFDLAIFNYYFGVKENADGSFTYDISKLAKDLDYWKTLGANTPVAIGCEYTFRNLEYGLAERGKKHIPGTFNPKARKAIVGLVRHIHEEAQRHGWPKLYFYPIDEPGNNKTENRLHFAENVLDFVHEVPGCQTVTTVGASDIQRLGDRVDVRIYAYGNYNRAKVLRESQQGHPFWFYENGMFYGHSTVASRGLTGFELLRSGAEVATAWGFDCTQANPYNDFDGGHKDWNVVFPGVDKLTPTIYWELCREGVDDCRYVATLQQQIQKAKESGQFELAQRAEQVLAPLIDPDARPIDHPALFTRYRWRIAREILNLLGKHELALPFPAVVKNTAAPEHVGPNLINDPSFEAGPQADGFPVSTYYIADPYSKPETKPTGALSVTDEVAHSGRYCLKWDFSQAAGKGALYDGKRYLIVNVQVPQTAAQQLRGKRIKVGYWLRLGGGAAVPGMTLRQFGKKDYLEGISYQGGVDDPAVWNHFEATGRLRADFESLDIHISCPVPDEAEVARKSMFYIDDVSLQVIEESPLVISTPLDEYYVGEMVHWTATAASAGGPVKVQLLCQDQLIAEQTGSTKAGQLHGTFGTTQLRPGIYTLLATTKPPLPATQTARKDFLVTPDILGRSATGPLRVSTVNPRYFTDSTGKAIYLTGSHTWSSLQDIGKSDPPALFDYAAYLKFLLDQHHNFIRLWLVEHAWDPQDGTRAAPLPWRRTGPGMALDGKPKFDLSQFDPAFFDRLRQRVQAAGDQGIYVSIMLFDDWSTENPGPWKGHPFHTSNNVNGIDGGPNHDGLGLEFHTLQSTNITQLQEAYVRKVVETVNDQDNVLYEIANETGISKAWQYHFIHYIKQLEQAKPKQHPIGITVAWPVLEVDNAALFASPAEWISPNAEGGYKDNPPVADGKKVILTDTDHLWGEGGDYRWVWKSFCRGLNPIYMDRIANLTGHSQGDIPGAEEVRKAMGNTRRIAERMNLTEMVPHKELSSSGFCLAHPGQEYLVYLPEEGEVTIDLTAVAGSFAVEWLHPIEGIMTLGEPVNGGAKRSLHSPFGRDAVLYLKTPIVRMP